jgi:hypothetical protein
MPNHSYMTDLQRLSYLVCGAWLVLVATAFVNMSSVFSLFFYLLVFTVVWKIVLKWPDLIQGLTVFVFYAALTLGLYEWQLLVNPEYFGFSGGLGVGADDSYFYSLAAPYLPADFPVRDGYWLRSHHYADALRIFSIGFLSLHMGVHPLDLLFFNVLGLSLIPFFARRVAFLATKDPRAAFFTYWMTLICPFLIANGLILIREGWMAMCFIGAFYFAMKRHYLMLVWMLLGALYLRIEIGGLLVISVVVYFVMIERPNYRKLGDSIRRWRSKSTILAIFGTGIVLSVSVGAMIGLEQIMTIAGPLIYREDFLESFIGASASAESGGTFYKINQLPWFLSVPLGFLFFIGSPFFTLSDLTSNGEYIPRMILANIFAVIFVFYFAFFVRGLIRVLTSNNAVMVVLALIFLVDVLILSQASMQIRHKVALMPLFYVIVAYGYVYRKTIPWTAGLAASISIIFVTVGVNVN